MSPVNKSMAPGIRDGREFQYRVIFRGGSIQEFPGGIIVDGALSRDLTNSVDTDVLQAGNVMGKVTASGKYAPSIVCKMTGA